MAVQTETRKLTERQERFCIEYVLNKGNGTEAARRAGYSDSSEDVLASAAYETLRNPRVITRINELREESGINTGATIEWAVSILVSIAEKTADTFECKNSVAAIKTLSDIMGWSNGNGATPSLAKMADKLAAQWKEMEQA